MEERVLSSVRMGCSEEEEVGEEPWSTVRLGTGTGKRREGYEEAWRSGLMCVGGGSVGRLPTKNLGEFLARTAGGSSGRVGGW